MSLARSLLLPLGLLCASLAGQDPAPRPTDGPAEKPATQESEGRHRCFRHRHVGHHSTFGAYVQGVMPLRELRENLGQRTGFGLGVQWTHDHGEWNASRTRLEWNTFPEGGSGTRTYAKNYTLSWDHLFKLNKGKSQAYLLTGIGGSRWYLEQATAGLKEARWATKLAITAGAGIQIGERMNLEARYVASSVHRTFDANTLQMSLGWRF